MQYFVISWSKRLRLPEEGAEALKHVGVLIKYFNIYVCAFIGMNNERYNMHGIYEGWNCNSGNYLFTTDTK